MGRQEKLVAGEEKLNRMIDQWLPPGEDYQTGGAEYARYGRIGATGVKQRLLTTIYEQYARISQESDWLIQAILLRSIIDLKRWLCYIASLSPDTDSKLLKGYVSRMDKVRSQPQAIPGAYLSLHSYLYGVLSKCTHQGFFQYHSIPDSIVSMAVHVVMDDLFSRFAADPDVGYMVEPEERGRILADTQPHYGPSGPCATCEHWSKRRLYSGQEAAVARDVAKVEE